MENTSGDNITIDSGALVTLSLPKDDMESLKLVAESNNISVEEMALRFVIEGIRLEQFSKEEAV